MTPWNSLAVRYRLVEPLNCSWQYRRSYAGRKAFWAEPDLEHAAILMQSIVKDAAFRQRLGRSAKADSRALNEHAKRALCVDEVSEISLKLGRPQANTRRSVALLIAAEILHPVHVSLRLEAFIGHLRARYNHRR